MFALASNDGVLVFVSGEKRLRIAFASEAIARVTLTEEKNSNNGRAMLRAVALDFPRDSATHNPKDEFLFDPALLVCPVTKPMYYEKNSQPIAAAKKIAQFICQPVAIGMTFGRMKFTRAVKPLSPPRRWTRCRYSSAPVPFCR